MGGREVEFREEEEVEKCGERSVEAQLVRPRLQPAAASDEPVSSLARPSSLSLSVLPPPPNPAARLSLCPVPPADSAQLFHAFYSPPLPPCTLTPGERNKTLTHTHLQTSVLKGVSAAVVYL